MYKSLLANQSSKSFSTKTKRHVTPAEEILKIETDPNLYVDIQTNKFQQKVWAEKLSLPIEFVENYFKVIKKIRDSTGDSATSFDPKNFRESTPTSIIKEYLKTIQEDLVNTYNRMTESKITSLEDFIKFDQLQKTKKDHPDMPQFNKYQTDKLTESERMDKEYQPDMFEFNLDKQQNDLVQKILKRFSDVEQNPLWRDDNFRANASDPIQDTVVSAISADRILKDTLLESIISKEESAEAYHIKYKTLKHNQMAKDPQNIKMQKSIKESANYINNNLRDLILAKRGQLAEKLHKLEDIHRTYSALNQDNKSFTVNRLNTVDLISHYNQGLTKTSDLSEIKSQDPKLVRLSTLALALDEDRKNPALLGEYNELEKELENKYRNDVNFNKIRINYGITTKNAPYAVRAFENILDSEAATVFMPVDIPQLKNLFELFIKRDHFRGLGVVLNYIQSRNIKITSFDLNLFKPSLEYYMNTNFNLSNLLVFMRYYTYWHTSMFREFGLTPQSLRSLNQVELSEYSQFIFRYNQLADLRDLFSTVIGKIGSNRILDKKTKEDIMDTTINYFADYTTPFMDYPHLVNNFVRESDVAKYLANRFDEPYSFERTMELAKKYDDRTYFHHFIIHYLNQYKLANKQLPYSYSAENAKMHAKELRRLSKEGHNINDKTYEILFTVMQHHNMLDEMKRLKTSLATKPHFITESICAQKSNGQSDFYSKQVRDLFTDKHSKTSDMYAVCMMKALLKEGDTEAALRVLSEYENAHIANQSAIESYYIKVFDHVFDPQDSSVRKVSFLPDLLKEREARIQNEIKKAGEQSEYKKKQLIEKYSNINVNNNLPMSFTDFKKKHYNMIKMLKQTTQQMMLMKMVKAAVSENDYEKVNTLFDYLLVCKEEEQLRDKIRAKIERYADIYDSTYAPNTPGEMNHPLRLLFKYLRKPGDDIETLVNKYLLIVPDLHQQVSNTGGSIRDRKEYLRKEVKNIVKEHEALFLSSAIKDFAKHLDPNVLESLELNINDEKALAAFSTAASNFEALCEPWRKEEIEANLTEEQVTKARVLYLSNPSTDYNDIIAYIRRNPDISIENRPENILAEIDALAKDGESAKEFHKKFIDDLKSISNKEKKLEDIPNTPNHPSHLNNLLGPRITRFISDYHQSKGGDNIKIGSVFEGELGDYYDTFMEQPGTATFVNHANGEEITVDIQRMATDSKYFTETVAKLAKTEISNTMFNNNKENKEKQDLLNGLMKSREFRKFYYFTRKFFHKKYEILRNSGLFHTDANGDTQFVIKNPAGESKENEIQSKEKKHNSRLYRGLDDPIYDENGQPIDIAEMPGFMNIENHMNFEYDAQNHIQSVFQPPRFDITDFKTYMPENEYAALLKEYHTYTRGTDEKTKVDFLKSKLLGHDFNSELNQKISSKLRNLFTKMGVEVTKDALPSTVLGPIAPESISSLTNHHQFEQANRKIALDNLFREEFSQEWNDFKRHKLNEYLRKHSDSSDASSTQEISFNNLDDRTLESALKEVSEISDLIDLTDDRMNNKYQPSEDHLAFEFFDKVVNLADFEYSKYEDNLHQNIYGDDNYTRGYQNSEDMSKHFNDIYSLDDPLRSRGLPVRPTLEINTIDDGKNIHRHDKGKNKEADGVEYYSPEEVKIKSHDLDFEKEFNHNLENKVKSDLEKIDTAIYLYKPAGTMTNQEITKEVFLSKSVKASIVRRKGDDVTEDDEVELENIDAKNYKRGKEFNSKTQSKFINPLDEDTVGISLPDNQEVLFEHIEEYSTDVREEKYTNELKNFQSEIALPGRHKNPHDEYNRREKAYNLTLDGMKHRLIESIQEKKQDAAELAIKLLEKVQSIDLFGGKTLDSKKVDISLLEDKNSEEILSEELAKLKHSLSNSTSPAYSFIKQLHREGLLGLENDQLDQLVSKDADEFALITSKLEDIMEELENKEKLMVELQNIYESKIIILSGSKENRDSFRHSSRYNKDEDSNEKHQEVFDAYVEYQRNLLKQQGSNESQLYSDQHKINVVRNIFGVMEKKSNSFGTALLEFGINHELPDAVRIGENLAGLNYEEVPEDIKERLKQYTLKNSNKLRERIETTGPMKSIIDNRKQHLLDEQYRYSHNSQWRQSSIFKSEHLKYGVLSEIYGDEKLDKLNKFMGGSLSK